MDFCRRLVIMGDIHGNITAFEASIADAIKAFGSTIDAFAFLGGYCFDFNNQSRF